MEHIFEIIKIGALTLILTQDTFCLPHHFRKVYRFQSRGRIKIVAMLLMCLAPAFYYGLELAHRLAQFA